jgi:tetratricopeptide (TPR) repeat protein
MKNISSFLFSIFILFSTYSFAQTAEYEQEVRTLMKNGEFEKAENILSTYLTQNPNDPDAWIMNTNLILNKFRSISPQISLKSNPNENVYESSMGFLGTPPLTLPKVVSDSAINSLKLALQLAPKRLDIQQGLCYLFSISNRPLELMKQLHQLQAILPESNENAFMMADYARNFIDRDQFNDGMQIYTTIYTYYMDNGGILSDMAGEYYKHGDMDVALTYAKMAAEKKEIDEMTYGNIFFLASLNEEYDLASDMIQKQGAVSKSKEYLMYDGLLRMIKGNNAKGMFQEFLKSPSKDENLIKAANYMVSSNFKSSLADFDSLIQFNLNDPYKVLVCRYFKKLYPNAFDPSFQLAEIYTFHKVYVKAAINFKDVKLEKADSISLRLYHLYAGWTYYNLKDYSQAAAHFEALSSSTDFYQKSMAYYFLGVISEGKKDKIAARNYYNQVAQRASESKYAMFCEWKLKSLGE